MEKVLADKESVQGFQAVDRVYPLVQVQALTMAYQDQPVLRENTILFPEGKRTAIIGPNGAGKSTLVKGMLGLEKPLAGSVRFWGKPFSAVQKRVAYIPQSNSVNWDFPTTALDVVLMGRYVHLGWLKRPRKEDRDRARAALFQMGMAEFCDRQISQLSGGQRQRVFIARALAQDADLYILDEPLAGIDKNTEKVIIDFLKAAQAEGKSSIVIHHDLNTLAAYFDYLVILNKRVVAQGPMEETFTQENLDRAEMGGGFHLG